MTMAQRSGCFQTLHMCQLNDMYEVLPSITTTNKEYKMNTTLHSFLFYSGQFSN